MKKSALRRWAEGQINLYMNRVMGTGLAQEENEAGGELSITPGMPEAVRELAGESIVLLKNENNVLPVRRGERLAVFGRVQRDWFYVGYGSGGDVHPPYTVGLFEGLEGAGLCCDAKLRKLYDDWAQEPDNAAEHGFWGHWPYSHPEMPLTEEIVRSARERTDMALVIIGRAAGEDRENKLEEGSFYLTALERDMLKKVTAEFDRVALILDCGNIIDMSFTHEYPISAIVLAWQLGQESGNALADVLSGRVNPSGRLSDTIAGRYEDYPSSANFGGKDFNNYAEDIYVGYRYFSTFAPEKVLYPFGYGLSYTGFEMSLANAAETPEGVELEISVKNTGEVPGKETAQVYVRAPQGRLGKAARSLAGYKKTGLLGPGETETVKIFVSFSDFASFDDGGVTGNRSCFVLEAGDYGFILAPDSASGSEVWTYTVPETRVIRRCAEACVPEKANVFKALYPSGSYRVSPAISGPEAPGARIAQGSRDLRERILANLPPELKVTGVEPRRSTRALFGAFRLVVVALRQQGFLRLAENHPKKSPRGVRSSFWRADLRQGKAKPAENTRVLSRASTPHGHKSAVRNRRGFGFRHLKYEGGEEISFDDVRSGRHTLDEFIATLTDEDLVNLSRGEGKMGSALGAPGNAGAFGGITPELRARGIPPVITADGPAGLRIRRRTTLLPCGTAIACAWNDELTQRVFTKVGEEVRRFGVDVMLSPGMNIHRDPLCGRNFEYYSEDPMLSGRTAAAAVRGIQAGGVSACPKHFACNNQEFNRNQNDSRVSMRALREIYLKNFEYCVREGRPMNLMTSYNKINGVWSHYNYDLVTTVLRGDWGYEGNVITDWWMQRAKMPEFPGIEDNAYRTRAQVDVLMPGELSKAPGEFKFDRAHLKALSLPDGLTRAELQRSAKNVLSFILKVKAV